MKTVNKEILIFSGESNEADELSNKLRTHNLKAVLRTQNIDFKEIKGFYDGSEETSFIVSAAHEQAISDICNAYYQDCYLKSYSDRTCELIFPDEIQSLHGTLHRTTKESAIKSGAYSFDPSDNSYWIVG